MPFKLDHVSDNHGYFPDLSVDSDLVIHSGDMLPNFARQACDVVPEKESEFQSEWVRSRLGTFKDWLGERTFFFSQGNHDFIDPCPLLREAGIHAICIDNEILTWRGKNFYGFPYVPRMQGHWNNELATPEMKLAVQTMETKMNEHYHAGKGDVDILVAHCPPYGVLDNVVGFYLGPDGNTSLANHLAYFKTVPAYLFCGHMHDAAGIQVLNTGTHNTIVSNAATRVHTFVIE